MATTNAVSSFKSFPNGSGNGSDFTICTLTELPNISQYDRLDSVVLSFTAYRTGGASKADVRVEICGSTHTVVSDMGKKENKTATLDITSYIVNNAGKLTLKDGTTVINIRGYHNWNLFGQADWTISNIKITAYYTQFLYTATFKNYDGTVLLSDNFLKGSTPYRPNDPTRPQDSQYTYEFSGWSPPVGAITSDTVYTAQYNATLKTIDTIRVGTVKPTRIYYTESTKTITFIVDEDVSTTTPGFDTVDGYNLAVSKTIPSGSVEITAVLVDNTYIYKKE